MRRIALFFVPFVLAAGPLTAQAVVSSATLQWGPPPPFLAPGAKFALLQGNPADSGEFTIRLSLPKGYVIAPHWDPTDENVTVISGSFLVGMGDVVKREDATRFTAGGFVIAPANMHHYAVAAEATVVQVHGMGPFAINYINEKDNPAVARR